jgi:capsular exopolysaccharide synthesis family protein
MPRTYEAAAVVAVDSTPPAFESADGQPGGGETAANKIELIGSRPLLGQVVDELHLVDDPQFNPPPSSGSLDLGLAYLTSLLPQEWLVRVGLAADRDDADRLIADQPGLAREIAINRLKDRLELAQPPGSEMLRLSVRANEPVKAADIANAIAVAYVSWEKEHDRQTAHDAAGLLLQQLEALRADLQKAEGTVAEFRNKHGLAAAGLTSGTLNDQRVIDLRNQLVALRGEQVAKQAQLQRARAARSRGGDALADLSASAPIILTLRSQESELERRRAELAQTYAERHPQMLAINVQIEEVRQRLALETDGAIASIQDELASTTGRQQALERDLASLQGNAALDRQAEVQLQELERQATAARNEYENMLHRYRQAEQTADIGGTEARIVSGAAKPLGPTTPGPLTLGLVGFAAFTALGSVLAFLLEGMDQRVQTGHQVERALGVPSLGIIPFIRQRRWRDRPASYLADHPFTYYAEAAQSIVMQLDAATGDAGSSSLVVTSALPGEGKTTLVVSLAAALARTGLKVCVLDLDLRRPMVAARVGMAQARASLMDYLAGRAALDEVVHGVARGAFDVVPVGHPTENALMMLKSAAFARLWSELRSRYDVIVVDSAPMLALSETQVVCRLAKHFIVATRWRRTDIIATGEVIRRLSAMNPSFIGVVLTMVDIGKYKLYAHGEAGAYYQRCRRYYAN